LFGLALFDGYVIEATLEAWHGSSLRVQFKRTMVQCGFGAGVPSAT
jgi:hypothetical protein